jgi:hypothetical protein
MRSGQDVQIAAGARPGRRHGDHSADRRRDITVMAINHPTLALNATSDAAGKFDIAGVPKVIWLPPLPIDLAMPDAHIVVAAGGYQTGTYDLQDLYQHVSRPEGDLLIRLMRERPADQARHSALLERPAT